MPHSDNDAQPLVKRQKRTDVANFRSKSSPAIARGSNIFAPFRTVGLVSSTNVPFTSIPLGKTTFQITTSVGRCLQTYDLKRGLNLVFVTRPETPRDITATYAWKEKVLAAWGGEDEEDDTTSEDGDDNDNSRNASRGLWIFQRGRKVGEVSLPADLREPIRQILVFGTWLVGLATTRVEVWKAATLEHYTTLQPTAAAPGGNVLTGGMCTMPTLLNKLVVGRADGWVEIWNVSSGKLVYTILPPARDCGAVTCLEPTPALTLLAIAYASGPLVVQDVLRDQTLLALDAGTAGVTEDGVNDAPVSSISFRTDGRGAGPDGRLEGVMATATAASGDVTFWDLNGGGRIMGVLRSAHNPPSYHHDRVSSSTSSFSSSSSSDVRGGISKAAFLPGQPVLVTSGRDNALKSWIFDETPFSPIPRVLHTRSGHAAPVSCLAFLPSDFDGADAGNKWLLSGGQDRSLWGWSLRRDGQSAELSQGHLRAKAKKAGLLASSALRALQHHGPTTTLDDLKAPEITGIAASLNRDGGIGALPGKQPIWQRVGVDVHNAAVRGSSSQSHRKNKAAQATSDAESSGLTGWESVVTAHRGDAYARTWFWGRRRAGRWAFPTGDQAPVSTVAVSPCGSFALVGSSRGSLDMYNLQSGLHRQRFPSKLTPAQARQLKVQQQLRAADAVTQLGATATTTTGGGSYLRGYLQPGGGRHTEAVTGIVVDSMDTSVVSCSLDGTVKFWDFLTGHLVDQLRWPAAAPITGCRYHAANDLVAFACADGALRVVDLATRKTIRELWAGSSSSRNRRLPSKGAVTINDFCFSNDGRWLVAVTQEDARLRVWDLPTSHLVDSVPLARAGRAVAFAATGEYLAVAPEGALGVHIWTNKTLFQHVPTRRLIADEDEAVAAVVAGPTASGEGGTGLIEAAFADANGQDDKNEDDNNDDETLLPTFVDQLSADMTTLSLVPKSRWQTLLHLDVIKARNKPKEAPKLPERAPFFLGTVGSAAVEEAARDAGTTRTSAAGAAAALPGSGPGGPSSANNAAAAADGAAKSRILTLDHTRAQQAFSLKLHQGAAGDYTPFVDHLKGLPPAQADLELRSLDAAQGELALFVRALTSRLRARRDYELVQAWMAVFLRLHGAAAVTVADTGGGGGGGNDDDGDAADGENGQTDFAAALAEWRAVQEEERRRLDALVGYCGGVVGFLRSPRG